MEKKLPKVFANKIDKEINNNEKIFKSNSQQNQENNQPEKKDKIKEKNINTEEKNINKKINEIINTKKYIYKIPVKIKTETGEIKTKIIGKNKNNIITIDNTLIKIDNIKDIEICEE